MSKDGVRQRPPLSSTERGTSFAEKQYAMNRKKRSLWLDDNEFEAVKLFVDNLRRKKND